MMTRNDSDILSTAVHTLKWMADSGIHGFDVSDEAIRTVQSWKKGKHTQSEVETLGMIRMDMGDCRGCGLHGSRRKIVFGTGNPKAELMFIGEGPGADEDRTGEPFVGAAGQLLTKIIRAIGQTRESVYIANIVKCRPPKNRNPEPKEINICYPFLKRQIAAICPAYICSLGNIATRTLLETTEGISKLRGRFFDFGRAKLLPTYHPSYLLRYPGYKKAVWEDMKRLMGHMENSQHKNESKEKTV